MTEESMPQFALDPKSKVYKELEKVAAKNNIGVKELLLSEPHTDLVCDIIYKSLPALGRVLVRKNKFKDIYNGSKHKIVAMLK